MKLEIDLEIKWTNFSTLQFWKLRLRGVRWLTPWGRCWPVLPRFPVRTKELIPAARNDASESQLLALPIRIALLQKELPQQRSLSSPRWACIQRQADVGGILSSPLAPTQDNSEGPLQLQSSHGVGWALVTVPQPHFSSTQSCFLPLQALIPKGMP